MAQTVRIGIIGDHEPDRISHNATDQALAQCAEHLGRDLYVDWLPTSILGGSAGLAPYDGLFGAPGVYTCSEGALTAIRYAREKNIPYIGTCQGCQHAVLEFARNVLGRNTAAHAEIQPGAEDRVIDALSCSFVGEWRTVFIPAHARAHTLYKADQYDELFTCTFGIHPDYRTRLDARGFRIAGTDETGEVRLLELEQNTFHVATFFQPQRNSAPQDPHPLIRAFLTYAAQYRDARS